MWKRFAEFVGCPICRGALDLVVLEESDVKLAPEHVSAAHARGLPENGLGARVEAGAFLCHSCRTIFPILNGLPILLTYQTGAHAVFAEKYQRKLAAVARDYHFPNETPAIGEEAVRESFSEEWQSYDYDGVIWELNYPDHESRLLSEIGPIAAPNRIQRFLEVGCGVGLTTLHAQRNFGVDAVGMDLSSAPGKATAKFRGNPFLHFLQASVFALPFRPQTFDLVYSRGVLHHTFSTEEAFRRIAPLCRRGGTLYLWVYGPGSINRSPLRLALYAAERALRPVLSRDASSPGSRAVLATLALPYWLYNGIRRIGNPGIQKLNFKRAVHAARDRFTPKFAHRHSSDEVRLWFEQAGFERIEIVDWRNIPAADHADFGRNTAVRGVAGE
jgi:SAM-dependent methyltransferase